MKYILEGIGSVMDISPDTSRFIHLVPKKNANERMRQAWETTGKQIKDAAEQFSNDQTKKKRSVR